MKLIQGLYDESEFQQQKLGEMYISPQGDRFRYVQNGGSAALVTGNLLQEPAEVTNYRSMAVANSQAIGDDVITVDLGGTAVTANQFDEGHIHIESSTGIGQAFRIKRHEVQTSTTGECKFTLDRTIKIALVADTSQATIRKNAYDGVIAYPTTPTGAPVGIALYAMTVSYFGWIQSGGDVPALFDNQANSAADESGLIPSRDVAGSVTPDVETIAAGIPIGFSRELVSVDSTMGLIKLIIDQEGLNYAYQTKAG